MDNLDYERLYIDSCRNQRNTLFNETGDLNQRVIRIEERQKLEAEFAEYKHQEFKKSNAEQDKHIQESRDFRIKAGIIIVVVIGAFKYFTGAG